VSQQEAGRVGGPCTAGVVFAMPIEADAFERLATDVVVTEAGGIEFHEATIGSARVAWCVAGVGRERAGRAARLLVAGHRPRAVVAAGFSGGLAAPVPRGSIVRPAAVCRLDEAAPLALAGGEAGGPLLLTVDRILRTTAEKVAAARISGATLVDMETHAVAAAAREAGLPCHALRVISDALDDELPPDLGRLLEPQSAMRRAGTVLGMLGRRPRAAADLWRLWERAVGDGRTLARALSELCRSLPG
jgi:adenosylhomocysteine nucleosidase